VTEKIYKWHILRKKDDILSFIHFHSQKLSILQLFFNGHFIAGQDIVLLQTYKKEKKGFKRI
jgi:glutaredoxin-related protein